MKKFFKRILGITDLEQEISKLQEEIYYNRKSSIGIVEGDIKTLDLMGENKRAISEIKENMSVNRVFKKLNNYKSEHEFMELSAKIYVLDDCFRKENPPFVRMSSDGVIDDRNDSSDVKLRYYVVKKLVLPGYNNDERYDPFNDEFEDTLEYLFGKTYQEIVDYMKEFNYNKVDNEMYSLNFYEI